MLLTTYKQTFPTLFDKLIARTSTKNPNDQKTTQGWSEIHETGQPLLIVL